MRLLLIRHGQTPSNIIGALDTAFPGAGLTALGIRQAEALPEALRGHDVAGVYASRLVRTQFTAAPLAHSLGLRTIVREGLEEISAGRFEMAHDKESVLGYIETVGAWVTGDLGHRMPGGADGHEFRGRFDSALERIAAEHDDDHLVTVFSHGAAIRVFTALATGMGPQAAADLHIHNTGAGLLSGGPGSGWRLHEWCSEPLGGAHLRDPGARDISGEGVEEAEAEVLAEPDPAAGQGTDQTHPALVPAVPNVLDFSHGGEADGVFYPAPK